MKVIHCEDLADIVGTNCVYTATGNTEEEAVNRMMHHLRQSYSEKVENMSDEDLKDKIKDKVHDEDQAGAEEMMEEEM